MTKKEIEKQLELLDYFAGKVLSGIYSDPEINNDEHAMKSIADICYKQAFEMLIAEEREKYSNFIELK
jgi:hypothetical protein